MTTTPGEVVAGTLLKEEICNCSAETLHGVYIFNGNGMATFQTPPQPTADAFFPAAIVGTWTADRKGGISRSLSLNFAGFPGPYTDSGTYQVNPDCTASAFFASGLESFQLIFVDSRTIVWGVVKGGRAGANTLLKQTVND